MRADPVIMPTFHLMSKKSNRGFTLIEVMIVLALLAALIAFAAPRVFRTQNNIKAVSRNFIVLSREVRNKARLSNSTYRIVFKITDEESSYWVERASGPRAIDPEEAEREEDDEDASPPAFQIDKSLTKKEKVLPGDLRFAAIETINMSSPVTSGTAYIHFFPEGFVEAAAVQITNGKSLTWTLVFNPVTGQADIIEQARALKEIQR